MNTRQHKRRLREFNRQMGVQSAWTSILEGSDQLDQCVKRHTHKETVYTGAFHNDVRSIRQNVLSKFAKELPSTSKPNVHWGKACASLITETAPSHKKEQLQALRAAAVGRV